MLLLRRCRSAGTCGATDTPMAIRGRMIGQGSRPCCAGPASAVGISLAWRAPGPVLLLGNIPPAGHCSSSCAVLVFICGPSCIVCYYPFSCMLRWSLCCTDTVMRDLLLCTRRSMTICSLDRRLLLVAADLRHKACEFAQRFTSEFHDRIQIGTCLLVEPERDGRVPPAAGLQEHELHGYLLGVVLEQGESEAQARSERDRSVLREQVRMQGSGKLVQVRTTLMACLQCLGWMRASHSKSTKDAPSRSWVWSRERCVTCTRSSSRGTSTEKRCCIRMSPFLKTYGVPGRPVARCAARRSPPR